MNRLILERKGFRDLSWSSGFVKTCLIFGEAWCSWIIFSPYTLVNSQKASKRNFCHWNDGEYMGDSSPNGIIFRLPDWRIGEVRQIHKPTSVDTWYPFPSEILGDPWALTTQNWGLSINVSRKPLVGMIPHISKSCVEMVYDSGSHINRFICWDVCVNVWLYILYTHVCVHMYMYMYMYVCIYIYMHRQIDMICLHTLLYGA